MASSARQRHRSPGGQLSMPGLNGVVAGTDSGRDAGTEASPAFRKLMAEGRSRTPDPAGGSRRTPRQAPAGVAEPVPLAGSPLEQQPLSPCDLAFCAREFILVTLPHRDPGPDVDVFLRRNGALTLTVQSGVDHRTRKPIGIPFGSTPRLFLYYASRQVLQKQPADRRISVGGSLAEFLRELGLESKSGGRKSSAQGCREQMTRLLMARLSFVIDESKGHRRQVDRHDVLVSTRSVLWWKEHDPDGLWEGESWIELGREFHEMIRSGPIPVRISVLHALKKSPMALDLYALLTRESALAAKSGKPHFISWNALSAQIGAEYKDPKNFVKKLQVGLALVRAQYPRLRLGDRRGGLEIRPDSLPDVDFKGC